MPSRKASDSSDRLAATTNTSAWGRGCSGMAAISSVSRLGGAPLCRSVGTARMAMKKNAALATTKNRPLAVDSQTMEATSAKATSSWSVSQIQASENSR